MRASAGNKVTMAEAFAVDYDTNHRSESDEPEGEMRPCMPHTEYDEETVDQLFPSIEAAEGADGHYDQQLDDPVLIQGLRQAEAVIQQGKLHGRRRVAREEGCYQRDDGVC